MSLTLDMSSPRYVIKLSSAVLFVAHEPVIWGSHPHPGPWSTTPRLLAAPLASMQVLVLMPYSVSVFSALAPTKASMVLVVVFEVPVETILYTGNIPLVRWGT